MKEDPLGTLVESGKNVVVDVVTTPVAIKDAIDEGVEGVVDIVVGTYNGDPKQVAQGSRDFSKATAEGAIALTVAGRISKKLFDTPDAPKAPDVGEGIVYKRKNPETGEEYIGKSKSPDRFEARQKEHNRDHGVEHRYDIVDRAEPGKKLDVAEETQIRNHGGIQKEGGSLANKRHQMSEENYRKHGGTADAPNTTSSD